MASSPQLISLGLDLSSDEGLTESGLENLVSGVLSKGQKFRSLTLGFSGLKCLSSAIIGTLFQQLAKHSESLRFLRLNLSNTGVSESDLDHLLSLLSKLDLEHLELFLGGNSSVNDQFFKRLARHLLSSKLEGVVLDVGYSYCSKKAIKSSLRDGKEGLKQLGLYLNG